MKRIPYVLAPLAAALLPGWSAAQDALSPVVISATRTPDRAYEVPASVDSVDAATAGQDRLQVNVSELLGGVPGLLARDRQNYVGRWHLNAFVRGDNLADRQYAGSVIVNESNGRYFEPAAGRTWLAGVNTLLTF